MFFKTETYTTHSTRVSLEIITTSQSLSTLYYSAPRHWKREWEARLSQPVCSGWTYGTDLSTPLQHQQQKQGFAPTREISRPHPHSLLFTCVGAAALSIISLSSSLYSLGSNFYINVYMNAISMRLCAWKRPLCFWTRGENEKNKRPRRREKSKGINENPFLISSMQRKSFSFWK